MGKIKSFYSKIKPAEKKDKARNIVTPEIDNQISETKATSKKSNDSFYNFMK